MKRKLTLLKQVIAFSLALTLNFLYLPAFAASLTAVSDTMTNLNANGNSDHTIQFTTPGGVAAGQSFTITFPSGFTMASGIDYTDVDLKVATVDQALLGTPSGATWGATFGGTGNRVLTITSGTGTVGLGAVVNVEVGLNATYSGTNGDKQIQNPSSTGNQVVQISVNAGADTGSFAVVIVTNDQVTVSTTIEPYIAMTLTTNSVALTRSGGGNPDYNNTGFNQGAANTLEANTNAGTGYTLSYTGDTLKGGVGNAYSIDAMGTKTTSQTGVEQFGINLKLNATPSTGAEKSGSGSGTVAADYNTADNYRYIVNTPTTLASAGGPTVSNTYTVTYIANVTQITEAAAYSTSITYICTGNF